MKRGVVSRHLEGDMGWSPRGTARSVGRGKGTGYLIGRHRSASRPLKIMTTRVIENVSGVFSRQSVHFSSPIQCPAKQGRAELLIAAVERGHRCSHQACSFPL